MINCFGQAVDQQGFEPSFPQWQYGAVGLLIGILGTVGLNG